MKTKIGEKMGQELVEGLNSGAVAPKKESNTYNRGLLKREIIKGEWLVRRKYRYTDDYAFDASVNYGETEFMPVAYFPSFWLWLKEKNLEAEYKAKVGIAVSPEHPYSEIERARKEFSDKYHAEKDLVEKNAMVFDESDFKGYGHAWKEADGTVTLFFGYQSFEFKRNNK